MASNPEKETHSENKDPSVKGTLFSKKNSEKIDENI